MACQDLSFRAAARQLVVSAFHMAERLEFHLNLSSGSNSKIHNLSFEVVFASDCHITLEHKRILATNNSFNIVEFFFF